MMRLFIAFPLTPQVEDQLAAIITQFKSKRGSVKWVAPKNIHLTVKFLGDTEESRLESIKKELDELAANYDPVSTSLARAGGFPNLKRPRVIWIGMEKETETLIQIADEMDLRTSKLGWEREKRKFKAHLTLGRCRDSRGLEDLTGYIEQFRFKPIPLLLDRLVLFKSTLTPSGPIYDRLHEAPLGTDRFS